MISSRLWVAGWDVENLAVPVVAGKCSYIDFRDILSTYSVFKILIDSNLVIFTSLFS
jgi:hypothetical protein